MSPIDVTLSGMVTDVKPLQFWKAYEPIDVTLSGMVTDVKPLQTANAPLPIDVTLSGMVTDVKPLQPRKASYPIDVTLSGMVTDVKPLQPEFVTHIDNQRVVYNTVEKSYQGCFENVKTCRFNDFNYYLRNANSTGKCNRYYCMLSISSLRTCWTATVSKSQ